MQVALGWDVGAWHCGKGSKSQDALVALSMAPVPARTGHPYRGNLRDEMVGDAAQLLAGVLAAVGMAEAHVDQLVLAIDATLGWPAAFVDLVSKGTVPRVPAGKRLDNRLLTRRTEQVVAEKMSGSPLSSVQDRIGSQSTKALALVSLLGLKRTRPGVWEGRIDSTDVTAIETYPALCKGSPTVRRWAQALGPGLDEGSDEADALLCAVVAWLFATNESALATPTPKDLTEGWIWHPVDTVPRPRGGE